MSYSSFSTTSLFEYLPTRYQATCEQQMNRREVYDFKDGYCSDRVYNGLKDKILSIVNGNSRGWVIAFIPGSTSLRTRIKYHNLAQRLAKDLDVEVCEDAIVSTSPGQYVERIVRHFNIPCDHIVGYHDAKPIKPAPAPMLKALELLGCSASDAISFGDRQIDIQASNAAGIESVACFWGTKEKSQLLASGYRHAIVKPEEILTLIR